MDFCKHFGSTYENGVWSMACLLWQRIEYYYYYCKLIKFVVLSVGLYHIIRHLTCCFMHDLKTVKIEFSRTLSALHQ